MARTFGRFDSFPGHMNAAIEYLEKEFDKLFSEHSYSHLVMEFGERLIVTCVNTGNPRPGRMVSLKLDDYAEAGHTYCSVCNPPLIHECNVVSAYPADMGGDAMSP